MSIIRGINDWRDPTYHNQTLLHAEHGVARDVIVPVRIESSGELVVTILFEHHVQVVRAHVMTSELAQEFSDGTLRHIHQLD